MIVQTAPRGQPHFVIRNVDHAQTAAQFAEAFGNNSDFVPPPSRQWELIKFVVANHEEGWRPIDDQPRRDPRTGLPYHLAATPWDQLVAKSRASPEFNESFHPYAGLLSSMHNWGLFNGRYGLSDAISIEGAVAPEYERQVEAMLEGERARMERLTARLAADAETAEWVERPRLFAAYELLEFFDTLALWFHLGHPDDRRPQVFPHVPSRWDQDTWIEAAPVVEGTVRLTPYPFREGPLEVNVRGRYLERQPATRDLSAVLNSLGYEEQRLRVVPPVRVSITT